MPAGIQPTPSDSPVGQAKKGTASNVAMVPFARSSKWHVEQSNTQSNITLGAGPQIFNYPIASYGYLSALLITVQLSGGSAAVGTTYFEDAPWSLLQNIQVSDVNGVPIFQLPGFSAYLAAKYGGYRIGELDSIVRGTAFDSASGTATATSQSVLGGGPNAATYGLYYQNPTATSNNCKFVLPIFFEFGRDGLGCLPNMDASARYNLQLTVAGGAMTASASGPYIASVTTPASTAPTMSITVEAICRSQPPATDMFGNANSTNPPAVGTVQYWTSQTASGLANGANTVQLTRVGNLIRNHILVWRNSTTSANPRATAETADLPSLFEMDWDAGQRYIMNTSSLRYLMAYAGFGADVPNGVIVLPNTGDPDRVYLSEYGDEWLGTVGATKLTLRFNPGAASSGGSLSIITNDIVPASAQIYQAPVLSMG